MTEQKLYNTRLFRIWRGIIQRCNNPNNKAYKHYGGRGIKVCPVWLGSFKAFYNWAIFNGYQESLTIDRKDNDGNYEPNNCRWVTRKEQANNTRATTFIEINGITKSISEWSRLSGVSKSGLRNRLKKGLSGESLLQSSQRGRIKTDAWREKFGKPITINGVTYPSHLRAAEALGLSYAAFKGRLKRGTLVASLTQGKKAVKSDL